MTIQDEEAKPNSEMIVTYGVIDVVPQLRFNILVCIPSDKPRRLKNQKRLTYTSGHPECFIRPRINDLWEGADATNDFNIILVFEKPKSQVSRIDRHEQVENADKNVPERDWKNT